MLVPRYTSCSNEEVVWAEKIADEEERSEQGPDPVSQGARKVGHKSCASSAAHQRVRIYLNLPVDPV
jgi:hypothetical protein